MSDSDEPRQVQMQILAPEFILQIGIIQGQTGSQGNSESRAPSSANPGTCRSAMAKVHPEETKYQRFYTPFLAAYNDSNIMTIITNKFK